MLVLVITISIIEVAFHFFYQIAKPSLDVSLSIQAVNGTAVDAGTYRSIQTIIWLSHALGRVAWIWIAIWAFTPLFQTKTKP